jgi:hypothetical protein
MDNILSFNFANWVTVVLMALVGFALLAVIERAVITAQSKAAAA